MIHMKQIFYHGNFEKFYSFNTSIVYLSKSEEFASQYGGYVAVVQVDTDFCSDYDEDLNECICYYPDECRIVMWMQKW